MADITRILGNLEWQLEWLAAEPSTRFDFQCATAELGIWAHQPDPAAVVFDFLTRSLERDSEETFVYLLAGFLDRFDEKRIADPRLRGVLIKLNELLAAGEPSRTRITLPDDPEGYWPESYVDLSPVGDSRDTTSPYRSRKLFHGADLAKMSGMTSRYQNEQVRTLFSTIFDDLITRGSYRDISFASDALAKLERLGQEMGNFAAVIDYISDALSLAIRTNSPIAITPILLVGGPGVGKSRFVRRLSETLGVPHEQLNLDNLQLGSTIAGAEPIWSTSQPGIVFRALVNNGHISPIIALDELDKAMPRHNYGDPLAPLHTLLEPESARSFADGCFPLPIDAGHVIWIATANDVDRLAAPLRSRFLIFNISNPTSEERLGITHSIASGLGDEYWGLEFDSEVLLLVSEYPPRVQRQLLTAALARAARYGESKVGVERLMEVIERDKRVNGPSRRSLGFAAEG